MERVAFLIEDTGERIGALLNPGSVEVRRQAGVAVRSSSSGQLTGNTLMDDPLVFTGGGSTELDLELLFDIGLTAEMTARYADVRELTRPMMMLAENVSNTQGGRRPPLVRFVWGKAWNFPGIITAAAERFDRFSAEGVPQRSWFSLRLTRVADPDESLFDEFPEPPPPVSAIDPDAEPAGVVSCTGDGSGGEDLEGVRPDELAAQAFGNPLSWRLLAAYNDLDDPFRAGAGQVLAVPRIDPGVRSRSEGEAR